MNVTEIYELADRYLAGKLSEAERQQTDLRLQGEEDFSRLFSEYVAAQAAMKQAARAKRKAALMARFGEAEKTSTAPKLASKTRLLKMHWLKAVAAVLVVFLIGLLIWTNLPTPDLFAETAQDIYKQQVFDKTTMSGEAFDKLFQAKKYKEALSLLKEEYVDLQATQQHKNLERQGFCYWELKEWNQALAIFKLLEKDRVLRSENNPAYFYQALTYLAMGDEGKCKKLLGKVAAENTVYNGKADKLLEQLE